MWPVPRTLWRAAEWLGGMCDHVHKVDAVLAGNDEYVGVVVEEDGGCWPLERHFMQQCACLHQHMHVNGEANKQTHTVVDVPQLHLVLLTT